MTCGQSEPRRGGRLARLREGPAAGEWELLRQRLEAVDCLMHTADNIVAYQAQLDRVRQLGCKPEPNPVLGTQSGWDRTELMARRARRSTTRSICWISSRRKGPLLDLAPTAGEETILRLGPDLPAQLKRKMDIMNAHGALTTNSDLKNDYSNVGVTLDGRKVIDTGSTKVGCLIGDHAKTSIGTLLNTGAYVGATTLVVGGGGLLPKFIPSFTWHLDGAIIAGTGKEKTVCHCRQSARPAAVPVDAGR